MCRTEYNTISASPASAPIDVPSARSAAFLRMLPWCCSPPTTISTVIVDHSPCGTRRPVDKPIDTRIASATRAAWISFACR